MGLEVVKQEYKSEHDLSHLSTMSGIRSKWIHLETPRSLSSLLNEKKRRAIFHVIPL